MDQEVTIKDGRTTLPDGSLGGSISTMDGCVRTMVEEVGVPLLEAVRMASYNPARVIGVSEKRGNIVVGKNVELIVLDHKLEIAASFIHGKA
jgi:N-acetylglucosamine-6-phosphate deacetylase